MTGFTPEEWRTAARVARRSIFTEGNPDLADAWEKAADQVEARFIPSGGMALTAEQAEDVRTVANCALQYGNIASREAASRLDSSLPATEPPEELKPIGWYRTMTPKFATEYFGFPDGSVLGQTHTASDGGTWGWCGDDWELLVYPPAPAEPAEEETKAEPSTRQIADVIVEGRSQNMSWMQIAEMVKQVFFPTETGPWQDWPSLDAIPADVRTVWDKAGDEYRRTNGGWKFRSHGGKWQQITLPLDDYIDFAPFTTAAVAVWDPELGTRNDWTLNEGTDK